MSELGDVPLDKSASADTEGAPPEPDAPPLLSRLMIGLLLGVLVGLGYVVWRSQAPASPAPVAAEAPPPGAGADAPVETAAEAPALPLPPLDESDASVRELIAMVSPHPAWRSWLASGDLARRFTAALANLAEGGSPTVHLRALAPKGAFTVRRTGGRLYIDQAAYARYDTLADVIGSIDTAAAASAYRSLGPLFDAAHRELGEARTMDSTATIVGRTILGVPVIDQAIEVQEQGAVYAFVDPALEQRSAAEKHLLRLGPRNLRIIQAKVKDVLTAVGLRVES